MDMNALRTFKEQMKSRPMFGPFSKTSDPAMIEVLGHAGFDFVILDQSMMPSCFHRASPPRTGNR